MFGLFKNSNREALINEFKKTVARINKGPEELKIAIGTGINMISSMFYSNFKSISNFKNLKKSEQKDYLKKMNRFEEEMLDRDPPTGLAVGLFKSWLCSLIESDRELQDLTERELGSLSRKGI